MLPVDELIRSSLETINSESTVTPDAGIDPSGEAMIPDDTVSSAPKRQTPCVRIVHMACHDHASVRCKSQRLTLLIGAGATFQRSAAYERRQPKIVVIETVQ